MSNLPAADKCCSYIHPASGIIYFATLLVQWRRGYPIKNQHITCKPPCTMVDTVQDEGSWMEDTAGHER